MKMHDLSAFRKIAAKSANDNAPLRGPKRWPSVRLVEKAATPAASVMRIAIFGGGVAMLGVVKQPNDHDVEATAANKPPPAH
ncbi:hypothetical protein ACFPL7_10720 [Dongia soli]|uniref:Uncharacterized protein n=1 Tax=Dongia soli TaxID=600628 RepID=A0ABU5EBA2_9PROT|nr:hypothetical protein [Dongia soli]MDY0883421.1 hypothetical protein [Dongia soli]